MGGENRKEREAEKHGERKVGERLVAQASLNFSAFRYHFFYYYYYYYYDYYYCCWCC